MSDGESFVVKNASLARPLPDVRVQLLDDEGNVTDTLKTDQKGQFQLSENQNIRRIHLQKQGYVSRTVSFDKRPDVIRMLEDQLTGYQTTIGFKPGESVQVYVHSSGSFSARLCRHGFKKKVIWQKEDLPPVIQSVPDGYFVEKGLNWKPSFRYRIPDEARPGIYSLLLESEHEQPFAIPMVITTPESERGKKKLLVLCSTNNWQTYNIWGGRSRYRNFERNASEEFMSSTGLLAEMTSRIANVLPPALVVSLKKLIGRKKEEPGWFFTPLSLKRPHTNCALEGDDPCRPFTNHLAGGEWRILAWLEREGIDYEITTGFELHQNPDLLKSCRALILSTHCEYWSKKMFEGLKKYHLYNGLWILNLSGNAIYREVDFTDDGSIRCLSTRFHQSVEDETQIIGVRFNETDYGTCAPYKVERPNHWIFGEINGVKRNALFGKKSLNRWTQPRFDRYDPGRPGVKTGLTGLGASGWETDKLSSQAPEDFIRVAKGQNRWGGADMVVREPSENRGGVFSASSITFGGALLIDKICSGVVKNVLKKAL